jgi:hypothetical protein
MLDGSENPPIVLGRGALEKTLDTKYPRIAFTRRTSTQSIQRLGTALYGPGRETESFGRPFERRTVGDRLRHGLDD